MNLLKNFLLKRQIRRKKTTDRETCWCDQKNYSSHRSLYRFHNQQRLFLLYGYCYYWCLLRFSSSRQFQISSSVTETMPANSICCVCARVSLSLYLNESVSNPPYLSRFYLTSRSGYSANNLQTDTERFYLVPKSRYSSAYNPQANEEIKSSASGSTVLICFVCYPRTSATRFSTICIISSIFTQEKTPNILGKNPNCFEYKT